ncbi:MAG TPA: polysaccharide deacetylase family protein [Candidatus Dormibacteraeota bacterium]
MPERPNLGRVGAGALIAAAALVLAGALSDGSATPTFHTQPATVPADNAVALSYTRAPAPTLVDQARPMVPLGRGAIHVPILMYHYIRNNPDPSDSLGADLSVTPDAFAQQMDWLQANGFHPVNFDDLRAYFLGVSPLPARPVIITLDDGYRDLYTTAFPILHQHGFKAVAYLVSGFLGAPNNVTPDQVVEMDHAGLQVGAHTFSHADLTKTSNDQLRYELVDSKTALEALVGHPVVDFCYPSGRFDGRVVAAVKAAGYQTATTTQAGTQHSVADRYTWSRVRVHGGEGLDRFVADLSPQEPTVMMKTAPTLPSIPVIPRLPLVYPLELPRLVLQEAAEQRPLP